MRKEMQSFGVTPLLKPRVSCSTESSLVTANYDAYTSATTTINVHAELKSYANKYAAKSFANTSKPKLYAQIKPGRFQFSFTFN